MKRTDRLSDKKPVAIGGTVVRRQNPVKANVYTRSGDCPKAAVFRTTALSGVSESQADELAEKWWEEYREAQKKN